MRECGIIQCQPVTVSDDTVCFIKVHSSHTHIDLIMERVSSMNQGVSAVLPRLLPRQLDLRQESYPCMKHSILSSITITIRSISISAKVYLSDIL